MLFSPSATVERNIQPAVITTDHGKLSRIIDLGGNKPALESFFKFSHEYIVYLLIWN